MGFGVVAGIASLAVNLVAGASASSNYKKSAAATKEGQAITTAQSRINAASERRQLLREERIRRARLLQGAQNTGTSGSSGEAGASGAITTNIDTITSAAAGETKAVEGVNKWNQISSNYDMKARESLMYGDIFSSGIKTIFG